MNLKPETEKTCSVTLEENIKGIDQKPIAADDNFVIDV